jgi:hypothetical protein
VSGRNGEPPTEADLGVAHYQGRRVTQVAAALNAVRLTTTQLSADAASG